MCCNTYAPKVIYFCRKLILPWRMFQYRCLRKCTKPAKGCSKSRKKHLCKNLCHEDCSLCLVNVKKRKTVCDHVFDVPCSSNMDELVCKKKCKKVLDCGHNCTQKCSEPCGNCAIMVSTILFYIAYNLNILIDRCN